MKLWVFSDLHVDANERKPWAIPDRMPECDAIIIAGDICEKLHKGIAWIAAGNLNEKPVIVVPGNHCFYHTTRDGEMEKARAEAAKHTNIHLLQDETVVLDGVRFVGATLWTDYLLYGEPYRWQAYTAADSAMNDHRLIKIAAKHYSRWRTKDAYEEHCVSRDYIAGELEKPFDGPTIVVTHHLPSAKSLDHERHAGDILNAAYASNLDHLVAKTTLWVHGHTHICNDYKIGDARVICNPRGYVAYGEKTGFDPALVVEAETVKESA